MLEQRLSKINFIGEDGFHWFIGQVTADPNWRQFSTKYGYRAKVRILGHHPATNEVSDAELPWAHFLVPPNLGSGKNFGGTSFALQGGETVLGFFLDGEDGQQPIIMGALFSGQAEKNLIAWNDAVKKGTSNFRPIDFNRQLKYSTAVRPATGGSPIGNGLPAGGKTADGEESIQGKTNNEVKNIIVGRAKKCKGGKGFMWEITRSLQTFIRVTQGLVAYKDTYIDPVLGQLADVNGLVNETSQLISGVFSSLIRLARKYMFQKIYNGVKDVLNFLVPDSFLKDIAVKKSLDTIFCVIENIIKGLTKFISDFLMQMIGKIVSIPLCAAEQFIGGLFANVADQIQQAIGPAIGEIQQILGPTGSFAGYMSQAISYSQIGLNFLKCEGEICEPQPYNWAINFGPTPQETVNFKRAVTISGYVNNLNKDVQNSLGGWFPKDEVGDEVVAGLVNNCDPYTAKCGPPEVIIFGGGGIGAAARAVVNTLGQIVGVNMINSGFGYYGAPYVQFIDACDNGYGATGTAIVENGEVTNIVMIESGGGYIPTSDITPDSEGEDVVGQIDGVEIVNTGIGYTEGDLIESECGVLKPVLDTEGRVIGADIISSELGCVSIPNLTINSATGVGAFIRPIMKYTRRSEFKVDIPPEKILRVVDCVSR
jgi:hypothetical protein